MKQFDIEFAIIGAGFGGIIAALELQKKGYYNFLLFERASEIGGTWRDNTYPGCACDVSSYLYSIRNQPNPYWNKMFSTQPEILNYLKQVCSKTNLNEKIRCNSEITSLYFNKTNGIWTLNTAQGNSITARYVLLAQGPLNRPIIPDFKGLHDFKGDYFHTSNWNHSIELRNKRIAIIGTGASAIQAVPHLSEVADKLYVLQRTAAWILPRANPFISEQTKKIFAAFPFFEWLRRERIYWLNELFGLAFTGNKMMNKLASNFALRYLERKVHDASTRAKLTPNYTFGCKRVLISKKYYPCFNKEHVHLIQDAISYIDANGIVFNNGNRIDVDCIVMATGFEAAEIHSNVAIRGLQNIDLLDHWNSSSIHAFKGTLTSMFPNLFFILGPNTGLGHNSVLHMMESQMIYIMQHIAYSNSLHPNSYIDIREDVEEAYNEEIQNRLQSMVWNSGCKSWYLNSHGKNTTIFPGLTYTYRRLMKQFEPTDYNVYKSDI